METINIRFGNDIDVIQRKASNIIRTTKYTWYSWAPVSLIMQFKRAANVYFLYITILTSMPFSPKAPVSMIGTFALVLFFTMCKELYEDIIRGGSDSELN
jgi:phospholipid-transporting ATPase